MAELNCSPKIVLVAALALLSGCVSFGFSSPETRFYVLEAPPGAVGSAAPDARAPFAVGLGPVNLPDFLNRPQIVTRGSDHRLVVGEFDHWGGALDANLARLVARRMLVHLEPSQVYLHPWSTYQQPAYQVRIDVLRLEGSLGGATYLEGTWSLISHPDRREVTFERFRFTDQATGVGYPELVASYSRLADQLGGRIVEQVAREARRSR